MEKALTSLLPKELRELTEGEKSLFKWNCMVTFVQQNVTEQDFLSAIATIKKGAEHNAYYEKKVKEGKAKMSVLNAVRNKIIKRVAAVISRDSPYLPRTKYLKSLRVAKTRNP